MTTYKIKIQNTKIKYDPAGKAVSINCFLEDQSNNPFASNGSVDLFEVLIPKAMVPISNVDTFIEGLIEDRIEEKYATSISADTIHNSDELTIAGTTSAIKIGMGITGPGITGTLLVNSILSDTKIKLSGIVTRQFTGTFQSEEITKTGDSTISTRDITNLPSTSDLVIGMAVEGSGIPSGAVISTIVSATAIKISQNADSSQIGATFTFSPHPNSNKLTSITPAILTEAFEGMDISGTPILTDTTIFQISVNNELLMSTNSMSSGSHSFTVTGDVAYSLTTSAWTLDLIEVQDLVNLIDFQNF